MTNELEGRTLEFAVNLVAYVSDFPRTDPAGIVGRELLKSGTSIGANYREANRAESAEDFIHKTGVVQKEAAETDYWLKISGRCKMGKQGEAETLANEARQLRAIFTTINRKAQRIQAPSRFPLFRCLPIFQWPSLPADLQSGWVP
ncbi:MAG TPA: four helix bundle protein [Opitutaceae bacterium]|nr:four helix bundle protein [Opitutaceae bacterium]